MALDGVPAPARALDGLPTPPGARRAGRRAGEHPNGAVAVDHVVAARPTSTGRSRALAAAGLEARRVRDAGSRCARPSTSCARRCSRWPARRSRRATGPPSCWGLVVVVPDLDALARRLGDDLGTLARRGAAGPADRDAARLGRLVDAPCALPDSAWPLNAWVHLRLCPACALAPGQPSCCPQRSLRCSSCRSHGQRRPVPPQGRGRRALHALPGPDRHQAGAERHLLPEHDPAAQRSRATSRTSSPSCGGRPRARRSRRSTSSTCTTRCGSSTATRRSRPARRRRSSARRRATAGSTSRRTTGPSTT